MSILFDDGSSEYLADTTGCPVLAYPFTMACWFKSDSAYANQCAMWVGDQSKAADWCAIRLRGDDPGDYLTAFTHSYGGSYATATTSAGYTVGKWHHACGTWTSRSARAVYIDGGNKGTNGDTADAIDVHDGVAIGAAIDSSPSGYMSGKLAVAAIWNIVPADEEVALLGAGLAPWFVRPASLVSLWMLDHNGALRDIIGGFNLTAYNGPTSSTDHPPIIVPRGIVVPYVAAALPVSELQLGPFARAPFREPYEPAPFR